MDIETFYKFYTPTMMEIISKTHDEEASRMCQVITNGNSMTLNHHIKSTIQRLSEMKMLIEAYPGCPYCFKLDCESDHK